MANSKQIMATVPINLATRIDSQPEVKELDISISKMIGILLKEALDAREGKKNGLIKKERIK